MIEAPIIRNAIIRLVTESEPELCFELRKILVEKDSSLKADIPIPIEFIQPQVSHSLSHLKELSTTLSQIDLPESEYNRVSFVYLSGDRLYTGGEDETLYVYSMSDHISPIATYQLGGWGCHSGIITDNYLYLGVY